MNATNINRWIGAGLLGLSLYGVMTFFSSLDPQPDPNTHLEAWSRFVTTDSYVLKHLLLSDLGAILAIFGTFALGVYLATSRAGRLGLVAMVITLFGTALFLTIGGVTTFAAPEEGQAVLAGVEEFESLPTIFANTAMMATFGVAVLLMLVGNVLLGVAVWRSGTLPKWAGALWVAGSALPLLGQVYIMLPIGADSTPPTVPMGAVLLAIGGAWMAYRVLRRPSAAEAVDVQAQPSVQ
jgi:multisubunit Na+/H+ antiporter MnhC subunit